MKNMQLKDLPSLIRITNADDIIFTFQKDEVQDCLKSPIILFNTFDCFEQKVLEAINSICPKTYTIGPLHLLEQKHVPSSPLKSFWPSLWRDDAHCLQWLDQREPKSVVYVNYGSITVMSKKNLEEFAWGLSNSMQPFLWVVRPDVVIGESWALPKKFFDETQDRGLVVDWCPQEQVLAHPSIGVFLTHCGWNSILECVCGGGLPVICWPFFFEQQTNCRYACLDEEWGVGVEVNHEVTRKEIKDMVRDVMKGHKGVKLRERALSWQEKAKETINVGGSSFNNFERFLKEDLHCDLMNNK